jgi:hypothetical protein
MTQMETSEKSRESYDTHTPIMQLLHINLFIMLNSVLQKAITGVESHFLDVWVHMHRDDPQAQQKLVSTNFNSYVCSICFIHVKLTVVHD